MRTPPAERRPVLQWYKNLERTKQEENEMKKKIVVLMLSAAMTMSMMTGCGDTAKDDSSASTATEETQETTDTEEAEPMEM
jgi:flagellar basal body-associated protein FliL